MFYIHMFQESCESPAFETDIKRNVIMKKPPKITRNSLSTKKRQKVPSVFI